MYGLPMACIGGGASGNKPGNRLHTWRALTKIKNKEQKRGKSERKDKRNPLVLIWQLIGAKEKAEDPNILQQWRRWLPLRHHFFSIIITITIIIITRQKAAYGQQGQAGGIVGPRYRSSRYILVGCSQCLTSRLRRSAQIETDLEP